VPVVVTCTMFTLALPVLLAQVSRAMGLLSKESGTAISVIVC